MTEQLSNIIIWSENKPGVFFRILWLFRRKMFNIESATVGHTEIPGVSRFTITVNGDKDKVKNICKQVNKLINVIRVEDVPVEKLVIRELALMKVGIKNTKEKHDILRVLEHFRARVINMTKDVLHVFFDSKARVKILKLLFRNGGQAFNIKEIAVRVQEKLPLVRHEVKKFLALGLIRVIGNGK